MPPATSNHSTHGKDAMLLKAYLAEARSVYDVHADDTGAYELIHRQPEELSELVMQAASYARRASEHLRSAWSQAFGRDNDTNAACIEAVKAIEAAGRDIIIPNDEKATFGQDDKSPAIQAREMGFCDQPRVHQINRDNNLYDGYGMGEPSTTWGI